MNFKQMGEADREVNIDWDIVLEGKKTEDILNMAEKLATNKLTKVSASQLRGIYDSILELKEQKEDKEKRKHCGKILIKLVYAKNRNNIPKEFYKKLEEPLKKFVGGQELDKIQNFVDFMEAVVAYSKK